MDNVDPAHWCVEVARTLQRQIVPECPTSPIPGLYSQIDWVPKHTWNTCSEWVLAGFVARLTGWMGKKKSDIVHHRSDYLVWTLSPQSTRSRLKSSIIPARTSTHAIVSSKKSFRFNNATASIELLSLQLPNSDFTNHAKLLNQHNPQASILVGVRMSSWIIVPV